ncbi:hypothetical protein K3172_05825 [Qipengyuania sp. 6B39]|uniref:hypothetical protein n=1 Tax=Qipengyuania proteolytica TaxID=2867239 RepID=UPI001C89856C|nr:hypothetical protein [Qipengyuania proteolytica]MBX7495371.1 hypothetical protein [Qipengyuania proteolytica]
MATAALDDPAARPAHSAQRTDVAALAVLALAVLCLRLPLFGYPLATADEQLYSLVGNAMTQGALPYVDVWDRKPFGLFALFAAAHAVGGPGPEAYQALAALFTFAGAWLTMALARPLVDRITATGAGVLYVLLMGAYGSQSGQSEAFHVPMILAMAVLLRDPGHPGAIRRAMLAMLVGGIALQVKYTVLPQCVLLGLWALWGRWQAGDGAGRVAIFAAAFAALGLLLTAIVAAIYALAGHFDAFIFANLLSFFDRAPSDAGRFHRDLAVGFLPLGTLAACGIYAAARINRPRDPQHYRFILLLLAGSLATSFLPGTVYAYYFAAAVPASILAALPLLDRAMPWRWSLLGLLVLALGWLQLQPAKWEERAASEAAFDRLSAAIAPHVDGADQCLWIFDGPTALYGSTGSCLPTRFAYPDHLNNLLERGALGISQTGEVARILARRPPVVVTAAEPLTPQSEDARALVVATLERDYRPLATGTLAGREITAWAHKPATE